MTDPRLMTSSSYSQQVNSRVKSKNDLQRTLFAFLQNLIGFFKSDSMWSDNEVFKLGHHLSRIKTQKGNLI